MNRKIVGILVVALLIATSLPVISMAGNIGVGEVNKIINENDDEIISVSNHENGEVVDQQQTSDSGYSWAAFGDNPFYAQSFKPTLWSITKVELKLFKMGTLDGLKISIRNNLTEADLTSIYVPADNISTSIHWHEFNFPDVNLTPDLTYYIVWAPKGASDENNTVYWRSGNRDPYPNGDAWKLLGLEWEIHNPITCLGLDFCFKTYGFDNNLPDVSSVPSGPTLGIIDIEYSYYTSSTDPDGDWIAYRFDFGNRLTDWTIYTASGIGNSVNNIWSVPGEYQVKAQAKDLHGATSEWSSPLIVTITSGENNPPEKPSTPSGPTNGKAGTSYSYLSSSIDIDGNQIYYLFDWDDGTDSGWTGPYDSGQTASASHVWTVQGSYSIKVKARDEHGVEGVWSDPLPISMPKNKPYTDMFFLRFLENHPHIFQILRYLLEL